MRKALAFVFLIPLVVLATGCSSASKTYEPEADREGIRGVFQKRMKELRNCYYETLESNPSAEGRVLLAFDLSAEGKAQNIKLENVKGRRGIEKIEPCLQMRVGSWQFPRPAANEETHVLYPLYFSENGRTQFDDAAPKTAPKVDLNDI